MPTRLSRRLHQDDWPPLCLLFATSMQQRGKFLQPHTGEHTPNHDKKNDNNNKKDGINTSQNNYKKYFVSHHPVYVEGKAAGGGSCPPHPPSQQPAETTNRSRASGYERKNNWVLDLRGCKLLFASLLLQTPLVCIFLSIA